MARHAVVLMNLGGPDGPAAVEPFLFNLFNDPAIIRLPGLLRLPLARLIARRRAKVAGEIYDRIGGASPILRLTLEQAAALEAKLGPATKVFVAMRYWQPMSPETAAAVRDYDPDEITLLPLYPQFSTTTTASSLAAWHRAAAFAGLKAPTRALCCYPSAPGLVAAHADLIRAAWRDVPPGLAVRLLFSAHGLPRKVVRAGDPYRQQVEWTAEAVSRALGQDDLDWSICYQSRVGPLEWIGPSVEDELKRAAADGKAVVVDPIAFVSEHSETLFELDIDYRRRAAGFGIPFYARVPAVGTHPAFIAGLADLVERLQASGAGLASQAGGRLCPEACVGCPQRDAAPAAGPRRNDAIPTDAITAGS